MVILSVFVFVWSAELRVFFIHSGVRLYLTVRVRVTIIWKMILLLLPDISQIPTLDIRKFSKTLDLIAENFGQNAAK